MKRAGPWSEKYASSSEDSSESSDNNDGGGTSKTGIKSANRPVKEDKVEDNAKKKRIGVIDYEALSRHGYSGGLSVLKVPPPSEAQNEKQDWSWSTGKERGMSEGVDEAYEVREHTRAAIAEGEKLENALTSKEKKNLSFSQREKRKRELGQASRGMSYVEEEKRLLRDSGVYSGFDS